MIVPTFLGSNPSELKNQSVPKKVNGLQVVFSRSLADTAARSPANGMGTQFNRRFKARLMCDSTRSTVLF